MLAITLLVEGNYAFCRTLKKNGDKQAPVNIQYAGLNYPLRRAIQAQARGLPAGKGMGGVLPMPQPVNQDRI